MDIGLGNTMVELPKRIARVLGLIPSPLILYIITIYLAMLNPIIMYNVLNYFGNSTKFK